ncbi:MAG: hypothetical protein EOO99_05430 [Pedobacter sp.]|nr:MAG: hypothetical protein EOO99_05430 [Pedobacter sp.]
MIFFRKKRLKHPDFSAIEIDMHSHLLPAIDDGSQSVEESVVLIKELQALGFSDLITTPHSMQEIHPNTDDSIKKAHTSLKKVMPSGVTLRASSEYYLDEHFYKQVAAQALLPMPGNRILVEFSQVTRPNELEQQFFNLALQGYQVILAHPERYMFLHRDFNFYKRLKDMEIEFQVNALSFTKYYGDKVKAVAEKLVDMDMIDFFGTDTHNMRHIEALKTVPQSKHFQKLMDSGLLRNNSLKA